MLQNVGTPATAKNVLAVGSAFLTGLLGAFGTGTVDGRTISFDVAQLDGPPSSMLSADVPCQSDLMVLLVALGDTCFWANDGECDGPPNCITGTDASDCDGAPPTGCSLSQPSIDMSGRVVLAFWSPSSLCSVQEIVTRAEQGNAACLLFAGNTLVSLHGVDINIKSGQLSARTSIFEAERMQDVIVRAGSAGVTMQLSDFSSKGPTPDGRFKPDVVAVGEIYSADSDGVLNAATSDCREAFMGGIYLLQ